MTTIAISTNDILIENVSNAFDALRNANVTNSPLDFTDFLATVETLFDSLSEKGKEGVKGLIDADWDYTLEDEIEGSRENAATYVILSARFLAEQTSLRKITDCIEEIDDSIKDLNNYASHYSLVDSDGVFRR
jgi:hypothetical protein